MATSIRSSSRSWRTSRGAGYWRSRRIKGSGLLQAAAAAAGRLGSSPSPRLDAELLLAHSLRVRRLDLYLQTERRLDPAEAAAFEQLLRARQTGAPIAYLVGRKEFMGLNLEVTPDVLIPRPETECLVEAVLEWARGSQVRRVADIGTGSGAIALALAHYLPEVRVEATDVSPAALAVAARNAERLGLAGRVCFREGDLLTPLSEPVEVLAANLPYVSDRDWADLPASVRDHEPAAALRGGEDGLAVYRRLLPAVPRVLNRGGVVALELDPRQRGALTALVAEHLQPAQLEVLADLSGRDRVIFARC
jgi:release factor glutamine methyltransferase